MSDTPRTAYVAHESGDPEWNRFPNRFGRMMAHAQILERENASLKAALDKYSEDEMLLIERCAKVADEFARDLFGLPQKETPVAVIATMETGAAISEAIRALKEAK